MRKILIKATAILLLLLCPIMVGCSGAPATIAECEDWTEGYLEINGSMVQIGVITIEEFMTDTGFNQIIEESHYTSNSDWGYYILSDGYSRIIVHTDDEDGGKIVYVTSHDETEEGIGIDLDHTTVVLSGGYKIGEATVEDVEAFHEQMELGYNISPYEEEENGSCYYVCRIGENSWSLDKNLSMSVYGDIETRITDGFCIITKSTF